VFPKLVRLLPRPRRTATRISISYEDGRGLLRTILIVATGLRFTIDQVEIERENRFAAALEEARGIADYEGVDIEPRHQKGVVVLCMQVKGKRPISYLIARLTDIDEWSVLGPRKVTTHSSSRPLNKVASGPHTRKQAAGSGRC
jgi:putative Mg2+ transporter-C (MgtC) family protein